MSEILVVQRDRRLAEGLARLLKGRGHAVRIATSCREADAIRHQFDVGIFELRLPDGSGTHLAARLSGFGRVRSRIFYTGERPMPSQRPPSDSAPIIRHGTPLEQLLDAVNLALGDRNRESVQPGSTVRLIRGDSRRSSRVGSGSGKR